MSSKLIVLTSDQRRIAELVELLEMYPEWEDDLDETACPTGFVTCLICGGGGYLSGRRLGAELRNMHKAEHKPDCKRQKILRSSPKKGEIG